MRTKTLVELLASTYSDVKFIVEPQILPESGVMAIYGRAGTLKSWLSIDLAFNVAVGNKWLAFPTSKQSVLIVQGENTEMQYQPRILDYCANLNGNLPDNILFDNDITLKLDNLMGLGLLEQNLKEWKAQSMPNMPKLVILDCLYQLMAGSVSSETDLKQFTANIDRLRTEYGCAFVIVHHPRKSGEEDQGFEEMLSSSILANWLDTIIKVSSVPPDADQPDLIQLRFQKVRHAKEVGIGEIRVKWSKTRHRFSPA